MALMAYPHTPAIMYKGYGGFLSAQECEDNRIFIENMITDMEVNRGKTVYIETYCMEMYTFEGQIKKKKELNSTGFGA